MSEPNAPKRQQVMVGAALTIIGLIFLLDKLHIFGAHAILPFWPVVLIVVGALQLSQSGSQPTSARLLGAGLVLIGSLLTLRHLGFFDFRWRDGWPLLLIGAGVMVILNGRPRPQQALDESGIKPPPANGQGIKISAFLSGHQSQIDDPNFAGGDVTVLMGSAELDLRPAAMPAGATASLQLVVVMGELKIKLPADWSVSIQTSPILGEISDQTAPPVQPVKRLLIRGDVVMGSVEVSN